MAGHTTVGGGGGGGGSSESSLFAPRLSFDDENHPTLTSEEQVRVEHLVGRFYDNFERLEEVTEEVLPRLNAAKVTEFARHGLRSLSQSYECLDASRTWVTYWVLHSLELLDQDIDPSTQRAVTCFLSTCQCPTGGFGGGPMQFAHLAPTYAAINAIAILRSVDAYRIIDREKLYRFLGQCRNAEGAFALHVGGEVDVRGTYCALAVARLTNTFTPQLFQGTAEWLLRCQTYEGGFAGCPNQEAHGGYTFCALAALTLLGQEASCDYRALLRWACQRQMRCEGGFQGRTNKLVDGCYSFWQGALFPLLQRLLRRLPAARPPPHLADQVPRRRWMFQQRALQHYLLVCCQHPLGGLLDKPGKPRDFYHTCYGLSGLSIAQHGPLDGTDPGADVVGDPLNELAPTHPVYNVGLAAVADALAYFNEQPPMNE